MREISAWLLLSKQSMSMSTFYLYSLFEINITSQLIIELSGRPRPVQLRLRGPQLCQAGGQERRRSREGILLLRGRQRPRPDRQLPGKAECKMTILFHNFVLISIVLNLVVKSVSRFCLPQYHSPTCSGFKPSAPIFPARPDPSRPSPPPSPTPKPP